MSALPAHHVNWVGLMWRGGPEIRLSHLHPITRMRSSAPMMTPGNECFPYDHIQKPPVDAPTFLAVDVDAALQDSAKKCGTWIHEHCRFTALNALPRTPSGGFIQAP